MGSVNYTDHMPNTMLLPRNPANPRLVYRMKHVEGSVPCAVCDRPVFPGKQTHMVHVVNGGSHISDAPEHDGDDPGDMAFFPVGSECRKLIPKGFIHRNRPEGE